MFQVRWKKSNFSRTLQKVSWQPTQIKEQKFRRKEIGPTHLSEGFCLRGNEKTNDVFIRNKRYRICVMIKVKVLGFIYSDLFGLATYWR